MWTLAQHAIKKAPGVDPEAFFLNRRVFFVGFSDGEDGRKRYLPKTSRHGQLKNLLTGVTLLTVTGLPFGIMNSLPPTTSVATGFQS